MVCQEGNILLLLDEVKQAVDVPHEGRWLNCHKQSGRDSLSAYLDLQRRDDDAESHSFVVPLPMVLLHCYYVDHLNSNERRLIIAS